MDDLTQKNLDRLEAALKRGGAADYEIFASETATLAIASKEGEVEILERSRCRAVSLRVLSPDGRPGFAYSTDLEPGSLARLAEEAVAASRETSADAAHGFPSPRALPEKPSGLFDAGLAAVPQEEKIERAKALERAALAGDPRLKKVRRANYHEGIGHVAIRNSRGVNVSGSSTLVSASVTVMAQQGDDSEMGWDYAFSRSLDGLDVEAVGHGAARRALGCLGGRSLATRACPALLDSHVAVQLLDLLSSSLLAESVQKGKSLFAGKLSRQVFSPLLTVIDDGLLPGGMETAPFDDEGNPRQRTVLIEQGVLRGFLYDQYTANREGCLSTGNAARPSALSPPGAKASNLFLVPGARPFEDLVGQMGEGIVITEVLGMHTANPISGDFSVGAAGHLVEGGRVAYPVKGFAISGNLLRLLSRVAEVGADIRFWGNVGAPSLLVERLDIAGC
ncbi:MAG: TldD/PmbA family protein [Pseudomonadota bacterium]